MHADDTPTPVVRFKVRNVQILDNTEQDWREHGTYPRTAKNGFPRNLARIITRVSETELCVINTEGTVMLWEVKP